MVDRPADVSRLIADWITHNPPTAGDGWEPYPTSLRIVNWIKWSLAGNSLDAPTLQSLALQAAWLSKRLEWHILGNHLFANAKALIFSGLFFTGPNADRWLELGLKIFNSQVHEQFLDDGGHFERSPMYHATMVEDVLDVINLLRAHHQALDPGVANKVPAMLQFAQVMLHPNGDLPQFNDTAAGVAATPSQLLDYAKRLDYVAADSADECLQHKPRSGYVRAIVGDACLLADIAAVGPDYQPGHAHADTLCFELSLGQQRVVVNTGTSCYGTSARRSFERGTASHSTVVVDGQNSSDVWGGFRVGRRARVSDTDVRRTDEQIRISAQHDGYKWLAGSPVHHRTWLLTAADLKIIDNVSGRHAHHLSWHYHFHPTLKISQNDDLSMIVFCADNAMPTVTVSWDVPLRVCIEDYEWSHEFGDRQMAKKLVLHGSFNLPCKMVTRMDWSTT